MEETDRKMLMDAISTSHHLGVANRLAMQLLKSNNLIEMLDHVVEACSELMLSGYVLLHKDLFMSCRQFGEPTATSSEMRDAFPRTRSRVQLKQSWLCIEYPMITFLVDAHDEQRLSVLQDTLTSICEAVNETASTISAMSELREMNTHHCQEIGHDVLSLSEQLKDLSRKLNEKQTSGSENLLVGLAALFPVIGLEADQEEQILDLVESYAESVGESVSSQVECTDQIQASLHKIMRFLAQQLKQYA